MIGWLFINYNDERGVYSNLDKLLACGVEAKDIFIIDNGSIKTFPNYFNLYRVPSNIQFGGVARHSLQYFIEHTNYEFFVIMTNSCELLGSVDYLSGFRKSVKNSRLGFVVAGLIGPAVEEHAPKQKYEQSGEKVQIQYPQPIATMLSRSFLRKLFQENMSYFNPELNRGWGIDREMRFACDKFQFLGYVDRALPVRWNKNYLHVEGLVDERVRTYFDDAESEMRSAFTRRYGAGWESLFESAFRNEPLNTNKNRLSALINVGRYILVRTRSIILSYFKNK